MDFPENNISPSRSLSPAERVGAWADALDLPSEPAIEEPTPEGEPWPEPEPLGGQLPKVHKLVLEMLPAAFRPIVEDIATRFRVPPDFPAAAVMVAFAGVVGRRAYIQPQERDSSWRVVPVVWGGMVADPSSLKSAVMDIFVSLVRRIEAEWFREDEASLKQYARALEDVKIEKQAWESAAKAARMKNLPKPERPAEPADAPHERRLLTQDGTFEALHQILAANPAGLLVVRDELTGFFEGLEKPGREQELAFYLESWGGKSSFTVDRVGRGKVHVPHLCISIFGGIQPAPLRRYMASATQGGGKGDGFVARFQFLVWPDPVPGSYEYIDRPPDAAALARVNAIFRRVARMDANSPTAFRFDPEAQQLFKEWLVDLETRISRAETDAMKQHLGKFRSLMPTLALLSALTEESPNGLCAIEHATQAAMLCDYLESHAERVYTSQLSPQEAAARVIGQHLVAGDLKDVFTVRQCYEKHWGGLRTVEQAESALRILEEHGWIRVIAAEKKMGRPSRRYARNPHLEARHATS